MYTIGYLRLNSIFVTFNYSKLKGKVYDIITSFSLNFTLS